ncbi:endoplasmic reticulum protein [Fomitiporia mediterranea MF3/22]|uniref:endoplasmic reticulum protein n=1 Tax=Fomitiporia mediterranea (strain MF3/22) TaxID=694068 RepID=UPI0004407FE8|nr:endoplasmic reticulum protein [Fomitiporia mediterranea MF3/22]EJD04041.1 endoplasmic reticulum protein [Fomitiporia mediterranea MF3/22]
MFRIAVARTRIAASARPIRVLPRAPRAPVSLVSVRFNSNDPSKLGFWDAPKLSYEQVKPRTEQPSPNAYLIDVREPDEVILGSIPSSVNVPLTGFAESLHLNPVAFKEKFGFEKPKRNQEIVFYCRSGKRSATAADMAKKHGYTKVFNYEGSWLDWTAREQGKSS